MKTSDITEAIGNLLLPVGVLFLAYTGLNRILPGEKAPTQYSPSNPCPKGLKYSRALFEACDSNYLSTFWNLDCTCQGAASIDPITPAPAPTPPPAPFMPGDPQYRPGDIQGPINEYPPAPAPSGNNGGVSGSGGSWSGGGPSGGDIPPSPSPIIDPGWFVPGDPQYRPGDIQGPINEAPQVPQYPDRSIGGIGGGGWYDVPPVVPTGSTQRYRGGGLSNDGTYPAGSVSGPGGIID